VNKQCNKCNHRCHCLAGMGECTTCKCSKCGCKEEIPTTEEKTMVKWIKKQWQKFIDWIFDGFYK